MSLDASKTTKHAAEIQLNNALDGTPSRWPTVVRLHWSLEALHLTFLCEDDHPWATLTEHDDPLWQEEVVEVFLAPGEKTPTSYIEVEINPLGAVFDASVQNPDGLRSTMTVDTGWHWTDLRRHVDIEPDGSWSIQLDLPWKALELDALGSDRPLPRIWRANFLRVERPKGPDQPTADEYSAWSPTLRDPADFHVPDRFGFLLLTNPDSETSDSKNHDADASRVTPISEIPGKLIEAGADLPVLHVPFRPTLR